MPAVKTKTVHLAIDVPCYGLRASMESAARMIQAIESLDPEKVETARSPKYVVKTVRVA